MPGDVRLYWIINIVALHTSWLHGFAADYALWGGLTTLGLLLISAWWAARSRLDAPAAVATAALTGVATVVALLINQQLLSPIFARPRPCQVFPQAEVLLRCSNDYSMPSDHCVIAGAFVAGLWLLHRGYAAVATVVALALAFSRVYVGVHYPFDTIAGLVTGGLIAVLFVLGPRRRVSSLTYALTRTRFRLLITTNPHPEPPRTAPPTELA